jgi:AmiR/NasT family two-component response regulator
MALRSLRILIVEDELLLAMDIAGMAEDSGHEIVGEAASASAVAALDVGLCPDLVFLDMRLAGGESGLDAARIIADRWPSALIVFVTANPRLLPEDFTRYGGVIAKPFSRGGFMAAMTYLHQGIADPPPAAAMPSCFKAAPALAHDWAPRPEARR